jgi:amino acid adenylation domain-containing protein
MNCLIKEPLEIPEQENPASEEVFVLPASFAQQRLWFLDQVEPGRSLYNVPSAVRIEGELDVAALEQSVNEIVRRHEILRTTFRTVDDQPMQVISPVWELRIPLLDLRMLAADERESEMQRWLKEDATTPFDLAKGPLLRVTLLRLDQCEHVLMINLHHIITDAWSHEIFMRELTALYEAFHGGKPSPLPELPIQYADYAHWQRESLAGATLERELVYWKDKLAGSAPLELPTLRSRAMVKSQRSAVLQFDLPQPLVASLKTLGSGEGASLFMTLLAAFQTLLFRYTDQEDVSVGAPIASRNRPEVESLIGFFLNTLVLRSDLSGNPTFRQLLRRVREVVLGAFSHQDLPFDLLVEALQPVRALGQTPLFQAAFVLQSAEEKTWSASELKFRPVTIAHEEAKFDLTFNLTECGGKISGWIVYNADLFDEPMMRRMAGHFQTLLKSLAANPNRSIAELPMLPEAEQRQLVVDWNQTTRPFPEQKSVAKIFEEQARQRPNDVAVESSTERLTYAHLNARANRLARRLRALGVARGVCAGVCMERSIELIVAFLAVLKAGGAYVPLDPSYPAERLASMLEDTQAPLLLTRQQFIKSLPPTAARVLDYDSLDVENEDASDLDGKSDGSDLAYVMFTSGSTGRPKGAEVLHRGIARLVINSDYVQFTPDDVVAHVSNTAFDAATFEIWGALLNGARLVVLPKETLLSPRVFTQTLREKAMSVLFLTTPLFNSIAHETPQGFSPLRYLVVGGDALDPGAVRAVLESGRPPENFVNGYGPTETTTFAICYHVRQAVGNAPSIPLGRPIANTQAYILDRLTNPTPIGVAGEIYLGGPGLARGYARQPELTAERFVRHPFSSDPTARLYKTGDRARWLPDGNIEFLGRLDGQVKVRGFRVELGEIETAMLSHPAVRECAAIVRQDSEKRIVGYVTLQKGVPAAEEDLLAFLKTKLPEFAVPSALVFLEKLPLTPNGKLDRVALPAPNEKHRAESAGELVEPRDMTELQLVKIWEQALNRHPIGIRDNFFALGGHSLLAVRVFAQIERQLGRNLPLATLFQTPTIEQLAKVLRQDDDHKKLWASVVPIRPHGTRPPFFCLHGGDGGVIFPSKLAQSLGADQPFFGLQAQGLDGREIEHTSIETMAAFYIREIRALQPRGPYFFGGYSFGGVVAFEMARQLHAQGERVALLALFDTGNPAKPPRRYSFRERTVLRWQEIARMKPGEKFAYLLKRFTGKARANLLGIREKIQAHVCRIRSGKTGQIPTEYRTLRVRQAHIRALLAYHPQGYAGRLTLFRATKQNDSYEFDPRLGWSGLADGGIEIIHVPGAHENMFEEPHVSAMAAKLGACLQNAQTAG